MCTLIVLFQCVPGTPLLAAANRDEYLDRPAEGIALRELPGLGEETAKSAQGKTESAHRAHRFGRAGLARSGGLIASPLDRRAGGTWLGLNAHGVFAALTNRPCAELDPTLDSRGAVVFDALAEPNARDAAARLAELPDGRFNPFNAFVADRESAWVLEYLGRPVLRELAPGAHVIGNAAPDDETNPKVARILAVAREAAQAPTADAASQRLERELACHPGGGERGPLDDTCVHAGPYGTRSSMVLELSDDFEESRLRYADGPPCEAHLEDVTPLLHALTTRSRRGAGAAAEGMAT